MHFGVHFRLTNPNYRAFSMKENHTKKTTTFKCSVLWSTCKASLFAILCLKDYKQRCMQRISSTSTTEWTPRGLHFPCIRYSYPCLWIWHAFSILGLSGHFNILIKVPEIKKLYLTTPILQKIINKLKKNQVQQNTSFKMLTLNDT